MSEGPSAQQVSERAGVGREDDSAPLAPIELERDGGPDLAAEERLDVPPRGLPQRDPIHGHHHVPLPKEKRESLWNVCL